ncbi:MAG: hypothetical protein RR334_03320, partial [Clostridia bacterium]
MPVKSLIVGNYKYKLTLGTGYQSDISEGTFSYTGGKIDINNEIPKKVVNASVEPNSMLATITQQVNAATITEIVQNSIIINTEKVIKIYPDISLPGLNNIKKTFIITDKSMSFIITDLFGKKWTNAELLKNGYVFVGYYYNNTKLELEKNGSLKLTKLDKDKKEHSITARFEKVQTLSFNSAYNQYLNENNRVLLNNSSLLIKNLPFTITLSKGIAYKIENGEVTAQYVAGDKIEYLSTIELEKFASLYRFSSDTEYTITVSPTIYVNAKTHEFSATKIDTTYIELVFLGYYNSFMNSSSTYGENLSTANNITNRDITTKCSSGIVTAIYAQVIQLAFDKLIDGKPDKSSAIQTEITITRKWETGYARTYSLSSKIDPNINKKYKLLVGEKLSITYKIIGLIEDAYAFNNFTLNGSISKSIPSIVETVPSTNSSQYSIILNLTKNKIITFETNVDGYFNMAEKPFLLKYYNGTNYQLIPKSGFATTATNLDVYLVPIDMSYSFNRVEINGNFLDPNLIFDVIDSEGSISGVVGKHVYRISLTIAETSIVEFFVNHDYSVNVIREIDNMPSSSTALPIYGYGDTFLQPNEDINSKIYKMTDSSHIFKTLISTSSLSKLTLNAEITNAYRFEGWYKREGSLDTLLTKNLDSTFEVDSNCNLVAKYTTFYESMLLVDTLGQTTNLTSGATITITDTHNYANNNITSIGLGDTFTFKDATPTTFLSLS